MKKSVKSAQLLLKSAQSRSEVGAKSEQDAKSAQNNNAPSLEFAPSLRRVCAEFAPSFIDNAPTYPTFYLKIRKSIISMVLRRFKPVKGPAEAR